MEKSGIFLVTLEIMQALNFPPYRFRFKNSENSLAIFDILRKKFVLLSPEEWVRQHTIHFLIEQKKFSKNLLNVEKALKVNGLVKRYDVVAYHSDGNIRLLVECKAPHIKIDQTTFDQIARYNLSLNADYLMLTNGLQHFFCQLDYENQNYIFMPDLPEKG